MLLIITMEYVNIRVHVCYIMCNHYTCVVLPTLPYTQPLSMSVEPDTVIDHYLVISLDIERNVFNYYSAVFIVFTLCFYTVSGIDTGVRSALLERYCSGLQLHLDL